MKPVDRGVAVRLHSLVGRFRWRDILETEIRQWGLDLAGAEIIRGSCRIQG